MADEWLAGGPGFAPAAVPGQAVMHRRSTLAGRNLRTICLGDTLMFGCKHPHTPSAPACSMHLVVPTRWSGSVTHSCRQSIVTQPLEAVRRRLLLVAKLSRARDALVLAWEGVHWMCSGVVGVMDRPLQSPLGGEIDRQQAREHLLHPVP